MNRSATAPACYFNHAGCSFVTTATLDAVVAQLGLEQRAGNAVADLITAADRRSLYKLAALTVGASPEEIALTDSHTTGWEKALRSITLKAGDVVLTTRNEWGGNLRALRHHAKRHGAWVIAIPPAADGSVCLKSLNDLMCKEIKLISVSWLGSNGGHIEPVAEIGELARKHGVTYFVDASQAVGQMPVDVQRIQCDVLTTPGRKWIRGPKGTGFMYLRPEFLVRVQASGEFDGLVDDGMPMVAKFFEAKSSSLPLQMGLKAALEQLQKAGIENIQQCILANSRRLWEGLQTLPRVDCLSKAPPQHGIVSFTVNGLSGTDAKNRLTKKGIDIVVNQAAFTPLDMQARQLKEVVRASPHVCTSSDEIETFIREMHSLVKKI